MSVTKTENLETIIQSSTEAFQAFKMTNVCERAHLMRVIADEIESLGEVLITTAQRETNLPSGRLSGEKARTVNQWRSYATALESGLVLDLRIDTPKAENSSVDTDLRKTMLPLGTVVIFGASNFPFAFSTAGGDTASAIAGGNSVIVKAHPGHPETAAIMGKAMERGVVKAGFHKALFSQVFGGIEIGTDLVVHPSVKAVGFTGSFYGGKALYDLASKREEPIPVFAEMGSINPLFLLPKKLKNHTSELVAQYIGSLTLGTGQFCTNPGVLVAVQGADLDRFIAEAQKEISKKEAETMLHLGIADNYQKRASKFADHPAVKIIGWGKQGQGDKGQAMLAITSAKEFAQDRELCGEVFGPFGLIVTCQNHHEMTEVARSLEGQLTVTLLAEEGELKDYKKLTTLLSEKCGRLIYNGFPTGVAVCNAMHHGGPFPATTDPRFTSVGGDAIKRFIRPATYQNWPESLLPDELKDDNPLHLYRTVNGKITSQKI